MTVFAERPALVLLVLLIAEWLYVCGYVGGVGMLSRYVPAFLAHGLRIWRLPEDILYSTLCVVALMAIGAWAIAAVAHGAWQRAGFLLLVEAILMVIFPLTWGWLLYGIVEGGYFVSYAVSDRSWNAVSRALPWLPVVAYPLVFLHKLYLVIITVPRRRRAAAAQLSHNRNKI